MVWRFTPDSQDDVFSGVPSINLYSCDITIGASGCHDNSRVSRNSAELIVEEMRSFEAAPIFSGVRLRDVSKKGIKIVREGLQLEVKETHDQEMELKQDDVINFGSGSAKYRFVYVPMKFYLCGAPSTQGVSSIGASVTQDLRECTHLLVDNGMPVNEVIIDAVLSKKPIIESTWLEFVGENKICLEILSGDCYAGYIPSVTLDGTSTKVVSYICRKFTLAGLTFCLYPNFEYKFPLQLLLQLCGSEVFLDSDQESKDRINWVSVVPSSVEGIPLFSPRLIKEFDLVRSVLSGFLCRSSIKEPLRSMEIDPSSASTLSDSSLKSDSSVEQKLESSVEQKLESSSSPEEEEEKLSLEEEKLSLEEEKLVDRLQLSLEEEKLVESSVKHCRYS